MNKRTRILVDPQVQWTIIGRVMAHWALFAVCLIGVSISVRVFVNVVEQPFEEAVMSAVKAQAPIMLIMFVLLPVFIRDTLSLSIRFVGPMYRLRSAIKSVIQGEKVTAIQFRKRDFWPQVAADFTTMLEEYNTLQAENERLRLENQSLRLERVSAT
ncbi:hypothetical protein Q31b_51230 [Novipirellula aureliae]|uniref:HAMP domain-containing protein n=1 Tax=Novipirellula aureliae TaxID=2527966 RepID=A0A5C6DG39_9BACT|nr:hypothetical protein [Novipirellula aureliae]TWU35688.1 hypothetical protein Q31b_51230 [Novipirellula aureliae]